MEPVALPYFSGLMSDITLGMFLALCGFGATCALLVGAWRAVKVARRWQRRRRILERLNEPPPPQSEVWIGCGCHWCAGMPERLAPKVADALRRQAMARPMSTFDASGQFRA